MTPVMLFSLVGLLTVTAIWFVWARKIGKS
jgi:hypothetical protein